MTQRQEEIRKKRRYLREAHGNRGMLTTRELAEEIGVKDCRTAKEWAERVGVRTARIGKRVRYDMDDLARALIEADVISNV